MEKALIRPIEKIKNPGYQSQSDEISFWKRVVSRGFRAQSQVSLEAGLV
jgi:hypothetical protein